MCDEYSTEAEIFLWDKNVEQLIYIKYEYPAYIDLDGDMGEYTVIRTNPIVYEEKEQKIVLKKPLIETSIKVKNHVHKHFEKFMSALAKEYDIFGQIEETIDANDLPWQG
ncbi:MAG: hypothetical protein PVI75_08610 [Gammaproteobacteria bacterium]|jgi:hypothetical protein